MFLDYTDNLLQLIAVLAALLISLFHYIGGKNRIWLCAVGLFTGCLLSSYFWASYFIIMGDSPNASGFLTNFGWNISFFMFVLLMIFTKSREELKYFHPLMLLPIPLNIWQFLLYIQFGGILNNIYEVSILTVTACLCIQSFAWYVKNRRNGAKTPLIAVAVFIYICFEFGMWTFSCFDGWIADLYFPCTFLCSISYVVIVLMIAHTYKSGSAEEVHIDLKIQNLLKGAYFTIVLIGSAGGVLLGMWMRDMLAAGVHPDSEMDVFDIISVILFLISIILAIFVIVVLLVVYFEQKNVENSALREARLVAERSNAAKSDFLANMSHEIRTPINAVLGMNKMIMRESRRARDLPPKNPETARRLFADITSYSANIENAGNNLLSIINDILDFSKIEAGKFDIIERDYMLSSVLNDVSNTVLFKAKDKGLEFNVNVDPALPDILYGDEMRIRQVVTNILNNAVKYTDKGSVTLTVSGGSGYTNEAGQTLELTFAVRDTGIGIKEEDRSRLFGKFERMDLEHNSTVEGTGLGLAITKRLLTMMDGTIDVDSEYGKGSVFTIRIPQRIVKNEPIGNFREKFEKSLEEASDTDLIFKAPDAYILIVDDTRMNLNVAVGLLRDTDIRVDTAESGAEAIKLAASNSYDMILLDQRMPEMDGTETLHRMREMEKLAGTPIICLTADAISGAKERYVEEGFNDYLSKPIDILALMKMLMNYLPKEKVIPITSEDTLPDTASDLSTEKAGALYKKLEAAGINTSQGLSFCANDSEFYEEMLCTYLDAAGTRKNELESAIASEDLHTYAIKVHALKSTSRTIGAEELSEMAAALERGANAGNAAEVKTGHTGLMKKYGETVDAISSAGLSGQPQTKEDSDDVLEFSPN